MDPDDDGGRPIPDRVRPAMAGPGHRVGLPMTYLVRRMTPGEWRELRAIRLEAVRDTPAAFSSSYAELAAQTDDFWQEQAAADATSGTGATFIACGQNDDWVGSASVGPLAEVPDHAHIHAVYVRAGHRGPTGLGARLVHARSVSRNGTSTSRG